MKKAVIGLLFLLACCAWTVRAEEILYVHNSEIDVGKLEEVKRLKLGRYPQRMVVVNVPERRSQ